MTSNLDKIDQFSDLRDRARQMARGDGPRALLVVCAAIASVAEDAVRSVRKAAKESDA